MTVVEGVLSKTETKWVLSRIEKLQGRAKFCASNAIRFLQWADQIQTITPVVSSFCALNAAEEAVAAFISSAKKNGYKTLAKKVNIQHHGYKAIVSLFAEKCSHWAEEHKLGIAISPNNETLAMRYNSNEDWTCAPLSLSAFSFPQFPNGEDGESAAELFIGTYPSIPEMKTAVLEYAKVRDKLLYATDRSYSTGLIDLEADLRRLTLLTLGLIWATIDMEMSDQGHAPVIEQVLSAIISISEDVKLPK